MMIHDLIKIQYSKQGYLPNYPYHLISDEEMLDAFLSYCANIPKEAAQKIKSGNTTLWDSPNSYVRLYKLRSFEVTADGDQQYLVLTGNQTLLTECLQLVGLTADLYMNPECYFAMNYPCSYDSLQEAYSSLVTALNYHIHAYINSSESSLPDWVLSYATGTVISNEASTEQYRHDLLVLMNLDNLPDELTEEVMQYCLKVSSEWVAKLAPAKRVMRPPTIFGEPHVIKSLRMLGMVSEST